MRDPHLAERRLKRHDQPAIASGTEARAFEQRLAEYAWWLRTHDGRSPSRLSRELRSRQLDQWFSTQRAKERAGTLEPSRRAALDAALGGWTQPPRVSLEAERFRVRLEELAEFVSRHGRNPVYAPDRPFTERSLAVWLRYKRAAARAGRLLPSHRQELDETVPGWLTHYRRAS